MHPNFYLSPLAACLAMTLANPVKAAVPMVLGQMSSDTVNQVFFINTPGSTVDLSTQTDSLNYVQEHTDKNHTTHTRLQQYYVGVQVHGGYAIVHGKKTANGALLNKHVNMNGVVYRDLASDLGQPSAGFIANGAKVLASFKSGLSSEGALSDEKVVPMIYIDGKHNAHWAYKVSVLVTHEHGIPSRPTAIVDAKSTQPFVSWNDVKTAKETVQGRGFGGNERMGQYQFGESLPLLELTRDNAKSLCFMETDEVKVVDMKHKYSSRNKAMQFNCAKDQSKDTNTYWTGYNLDGYDMDNGAYSPTNDALYAGYVIKHMYHDWYGIEALTKSDGKPMQLVMRVHYGEGYENAYWDGRQMTFGDGESMMHPLVSLGVGGHEISHGFTEQHSALEYYGESGGMNEAFSDMAAQAAEFYSVGKSSWMIGAEIMKIDSGYDALRFMDKPSRDGSSIDTADEYEDRLDVHNSSGVYNHLFYILANQPGWDTRKAFDLMVKANMDYWTPYSTFEEGGCGLISAAHDFNYAVDDVVRSLNEVAIESDTCNKAHEG